MRNQRGRIVIFSPNEVPERPETHDEVLRDGVSEGELEGLSDYGAVAAAKAALGEDEFNRRVEIATRILELVDRRKLARFQMGH